MNDAAARDPNLRLVSEQPANLDSSNENVENSQPTAKFTFR